jgi:hypothetical protein
VEGGERGGGGVRMQQGNFVKIDSDADTLQAIINL